MATKGVDCSTNGLGIKSNISDEIKKNTKKGGTKKNSRKVKQEKIQLKCIT